MKLSIIVPNYNNGKYLNRCIDSILTQSFEDYELIIIDDGSTDNSKEVINSYKDKRIIKIFQYNQNASVARNRGIEIAKGEYLYFLDSDDEIFDKDTLSRIIQDIKGNDLLIGDYDIIDENSKIVQHFGLKDKDIIDTSSPFDYCARSPVPSNKLYRRRIITNNNLYYNNVRIGQDLNFFLKYLSLCKSVITVNYSIYKYRVLETSMSRKTNLNFIDIYNSFQGVKKFYSDNKLDNLYNRYVSIVELFHYNYQFNKVIKIKDRKAKRAVYKLFIYYFSTVNKKECFKCKLYYGLRLRVLAKKIFYFF